MKAGLSACSNGQKRKNEDSIIKLQNTLSDMGIKAVAAEHLFEENDIFSGTDEQRAADLMRFYRDDSIGVIYDVSGGDLANGVLKYLDWDVIAHSDKTYWGYSDLTTVINAIYTKTGRESVLYNVRNLVDDQGDMQQKRFGDHVASRNNDLFEISYKFLQGRHMEGIVLGGNLRCFLKLAGTEYFPDLKDAILLLESYSGGTGAIKAAFVQLEQMGVFDLVAGILLGTHTKYEASDPLMSVFDLLRPHIPDDLPVARTPDIGHGADSGAVVIGRRYALV